MRPRPALRLCALGSAAVLGLLVCVAPAEARPQPVHAPVAAASGSASLAEQVAALNADIERVGDELAAGAEAYERAAGDLERLIQLEFAGDAELGSLQEAASESRSLLAGLARSAYKGTLSPSVAALMSGDPRAVADLAYVRKSVNRLGVSREQVVRDLDAQTLDAGRAQQETEALRRQALVQREALEGQLAALTEKTDRLTSELTAAAARLAEAKAKEQAAALAAAQAAAARNARDAEARQALAAAVAASAAAGSTAGGGGCLPASTHGEANGFLSDASLCPLEAGGGHRLRTDAALAFNALNRARVAATGSPICITDSYRSYAEQVDVFRRKPNLAATPGRSQHGWGMAVDLCGGIQTFGSEAHVWMQVNAPRLGWYHPAWARQGGSKPEAWHWEFAG